MTATTTWLDVMPALPLARGVPVVLPGAMRSLGIVLSGGSPDAYIQEGMSGPSRWWHIANDGVRVDLDDSQGFGYALRRLWQLRGVGVGEALPMEEFEPWHGWMARHLGGETTEADRLGLAGFWRKVTP